MRATKSEILSYLREIKEELQEEGIISLALFGSFARQKESIYSDIDIAISKDKKFLQSHSPYYYFEIIEKLKSRLKAKFHRNIDIYDLDGVSSFKESIKKDLLYV